MRPAKRFPESSWLQSSRPASVQMTVRHAVSPPGSHHIRRNRTPVPRLPRRGYTPKPRVASAASAPWESERHQRVYPNGVAQGGDKTTRHDATLSGLKRLSRDRSPRVRSLRLRPWAAGCNPFGVDGLLIRRMGFQPVRLERRRSGRAWTPILCDREQLPRADLHFALFVPLRGNASGCDGSGLVAILPAGAGCFGNGRALSQKSYHRPTPTSFSFRS